MIAKLKFKVLPWHLEQALVQKYGFSVYSRQQGEFIILTKTEPKKKEPPKVNDQDFLTEEHQNNLIKCCNRVVDHYVRPDLHIKSIMIRLNNLASTFNPAERKFILDWGAKYVASDDLIDSNAS